MGTSRSWAELSGKLNRLAAEYAALPREVVHDEASIAQKSTQIALPSALRGVKKNPKIDVRRIETGGGDVATATVFPTGPAHLVEGPIRAHTIPAKGGGLVVVPHASEGGVHGPRGVRRKVKHPGAPAQRRWTKGVTAAMPLMKRIPGVKSGSALRRAF